VRVHWQRSYLTTLSLLGEREVEGTYTDSVEGAAFAQELTRAPSREARARLLAREATAILMDVAALGMTP
jgi:hypothetical protein